MIYLQPDDPPLLVGFLSSHIQLPCDGGASAVFLSYETFRHICERRDNEHSEHRVLVLSRLSIVTTNPSHVGCLTRIPTNWTSGRGRKEIQRACW